MVKWFVAALALAALNAHAENVRPFSCAHGEAGLVCEPVADLANLEPCEEGPQVDRPVLIRSGWLHEDILKPRTEQPEQSDPLGSQVVRPMPISAVESADPTGQFIPRSITPAAVQPGPRCAMLVPQNVSTLCGSDSIVIIQGTNGDTCRPAVDTDISL